MGDEIILTTDEYKDILLKLQQYKKDRDITSDMQIPGLLGNILEELTEYTRSFDRCETIDALCDIVVFSLNAMAVTDEWCDIKSDNLVIDNVLYKDFSKYYNYCSFAKLAIKAVNQVCNKEQHIGLDKLVRICFCLIKSVGFNPYKCMQETLKEISSRKGKWNNEIKKFVKDPGAYNIADAIERTEHNVQYLISDIELEKEDEEYYYVSYKKHGQGDHFTNETIKYCKWYKAEYENCKLNN